ncbi:hypothetical protein GYMLUDRAFT_260001 [Collybiopsis luxurians FD-317 M1]|uniref:Flavin-containing monooxygenase n=1 Tax=Collybiopsis luxurians FD-317 M1 TaxID=944289 RepID=A0A0D0D0Y8_9AGAR|nr:hypothetical protein GYMLUDRAFT_260001 [Collybiopsis luxurians FD-317 M1]
MDTYEVASEWLAKLTSCLEQKDACGFTSLFHSNGWLRDLLVFTWNLRTLSGHAEISKYTAANIASTTISDLKLCSDQYFKPAPGDQPGSVSSGFTFSTSIGNGRGLFTLTQASSESGSDWKAFTLLMCLESLKGHEPIGAEQGVYHGQSACWSEVRENRRRATEEDLQALIIGAGQNGLQVAARFQQMGIPTLVVEKNARVGDQWRKRYPTLTLHTTKQHHTMLYQPYPQNWPRYTPRDKVADWLEQYTVSQDLLIWTNSQPLATPSYDPVTKKWTVSIDRDGQIVTIHPNHIILATGTLGRPYVPDIEGRDLFKGEAFHSELYSGGSTLSGKRVVVVGTGNSGADIALDAHVRGAREVTLLQRSSTCVQSAKTIGEMLDEVWGPEVPTEVGDFRGEAVPFKLRKQLLGEQKDVQFAKDKYIYEGLAKAGMDVNFGPDGAGLLPLVYERGGGKSFFLFTLLDIRFYVALQDIVRMDIGCAEYIISGKIKVKSGAGIKKFSENALVLDDGSTLEADVVVFATGFINIRGVMKDIFGDAIDKTGSVQGLDEEGEMRGGYRSTGHPGLWFAPGDFEQSRFGSRLLAIQIQALDLGYMKF